MLKSYLGHANFRQEKELDLYSSMMEVRNSTWKGPLEDQHAKNSAKLREDDQQNFSLSPLNLQLGRLASSIPLIVDLEQSKSSDRCNNTKISCPCGNELHFLNYIGLINSVQIIAPVSIDSATRTPQSSLIFKSSKQRRKVQSISTLTDLLADFSPAVKPHDMILSPTARWIFDSIEAAISRSALMKSSLLFQPVIIDDMKNLTDPGPASVLDEDVKGSPEERKSLAVAFERRKSEPNFFKQSVSSCSSTDSGTSYRSTPSICCFNKSAIIHCVWKNKIPHFIFSVNDDRGNVYVATPLKVKSSSIQGLDYIYLFQSWSNEGSKPKKHAIGRLDLAGKMTVSSTLYLNWDRSKVMETEFVLSAPNEEHPFIKTQKPISNATKANGFSRKTSDLFRSVHLYKHGDGQNLGQSGSSAEEVMWHLYAGELNSFNETHQANYLADDLSHNYELAAVVVKDYGYGSKKGSISGGWGLKFLKEGQVENADSHQKPTMSSKICEEDSKRNRMKSARDVNALVPAGFHGGPVARGGGPSSITERWRSNRQCDCGGWDVGCPIKVLKNNYDHSNVLPLVESEEEHRSLQLFQEGGRQDEPSLKLQSLNEDLYIVYFQPTLSALQSFSIAVANIHSQTPGLYPDM